MTPSATKTPWHLWAVSVLGLFWNGFGGFDFTMSMLQGETYYRAGGMSEAHIAYMKATPAWMIAAWGLGTLGAVLGTVLLLLRSRWAFHVFGASLVGFVLSVIWGHFLSDGAAYQSIPLQASIFAGCVFFVWYAWTMTKRGVLR